MPSNRDPESNLQPEEDYDRETAFDPFDALGIRCDQRLSPNDVKKAFHRASLILHPDRRLQSTLHLFPSFVEAQDAYLYLSASHANVQLAYQEWQDKHTVSWTPNPPTPNDMFFPLRGRNLPNPTPDQITSSGSGSGSGSGNNYPSSRPRPFRGTADDPIVLDSDSPSPSSDSDSNVEILPDPQRPAPATASQPTTTNVRSGVPASEPLDNSSRRHLSTNATRDNRAKATTQDNNPNSSRSSSSSRGSRGRGDYWSGSGSGSQGRVHRSGGNSVRNAPIANPVTNDFVVLGEWRGSSSNPRNAVVGRFDSRGRFSRRIVAKDINGDPTPSTNVTSCPHEEVDYRRPFRNMDFLEVRLEADRQIRLPAHLRP
jgi:hypothetical protein